MQVSVIVCTRNRATLVASCLDSIAIAINESLPSTSELVVVDNASTDDTQARLSQWAANASIAVKSVREPEKGLSNARNCGIRASEGELLIFTDDDCVMDKDFIKNCLKHAQQDDQPVMRGGRIELGDPTDLPITIKTQMTVKRWSKARNSSRYDNMVDTLYGCSMVIPRAIVNKVGFFDPLFGAGSPIPSADDTDYIFRVYLAGFAIEYVPDIIIHHFHGRKLKPEAHKLFRGYCMGTGALYMKYGFINPDFCRPFFWHLRTAIKEIYSGQNDYVPGTDFSHKDRVISTVEGIFLYLYVLIFKRTQPKPS